MKFIVFVLALFTALVLFNTPFAQGADLGASIPCPCDQCECTPVKNCGCGGLGVKVPVPPPAPPPGWVCDAQDCRRVSNNAGIGYVVASAAPVSAPVLSVSQGQNVAYTATSRAETPFMQRGPVRGFFAGIVERVHSRRAARTSGCN